jgi:hypothetical protein
VAVIVLIGMLIAAANDVGRQFWSVSFQVPTSGSFSSMVGSRMCRTSEGIFCNEKSSRVEYDS